MLAGVTLISQLGFSAAGSQNEETDLAVGPVQDLQRSQQSNNLHVWCNPPVGGVELSGYQFALRNTKSGETKGWRLQAGATQAAFPNLRAGANYEVYVSVCTSLRGMRVAT